MTAVAASAESPQEAAAQEIIRAGAQPSSTGSSDLFTGRARIDPVWPADDDISASGGLVTFEPGATATTAMTHLAVTGTIDGRNVAWMEKVSDEQYKAP